MLVTAAEHAITQQTQTHTCEPLSRGREREHTMDPEAVLVKDFSECTEDLSERPKSSFPQPRTTQSRQEAGEIEPGSLLRGFFFSSCALFCGASCFSDAEQKGKRGSGPNSEDGVSRRKDRGIEKRRER